MTNAPRPSAEIPTADLSRSLASKSFNFERPAVAANDNLVTEGLRLANNRESGAERHWLLRYTVDRFMTNTEVDSELTTYGAEVQSQTELVLAQATGLTAIWNNERQLRQHNNQLERYAETYGDEAQLVIESQLDSKEADSEAVLGVIDENSTPEEIAKIEAQQEEHRLKEEALERWQRFARQEKPGGMWKAKSFGEAVLSKENIADRWKSRENLWGFLKTMWADWTQWKAVKAVVPSVNVATFAAREGQEVVDRYRDTAETVGDGVEAVLDAKKLQKKMRREGAETVVLTTETARSEYVRNQILRLLRGEVSRAQVLASVKGALERFRRQDPQAFAKMVRGYGMSARQMNTRAGFYELFKNMALWYTPWSDRGERGFIEANETAIPIWGSYAAWRDINVDNGLSLSIRVGFATVGTALDIGTILSLGSLSPVLAGGKILLVGGGTKLAQGITKAGVRVAVAQGARRLGRLSLSELLGSLPRAARNAVKGAGSKAFVVGAAGYTALSAGLDWLFDIEDRVFDVAMVAAQTAMDTEFTYEQRRLLRIVGTNVDDVVEEAYDTLREDDPEAAVEEAEVQTPLAANDNRAPELTDGQIADVSRTEEDRLAA